MCRRVFYYISINYIYCELRWTQSTIYSQIMGLWTVYIIKCNDESYYVRCTSNLEERLKSHRNGYVISTKYRTPIQLITYINFNDKYKAYNFEKYLKSGSGRAFMNKRFI
ncbi:GIY-YIG nuclease family protein [Jejudonia soesokkakensis]|uniref:GIY-YIG nuclease family protein n=1 Tax=Jejudonia soesokkakensis TaxID=1323432 RepID=A0ABW2MWQ4_9FLAO